MNKHSEDFLNGYTLTRSWFDYCFDHRECKPIHTALFTWIVELDNRLGWKKQFGLPSAATMEGLSIGNRNTYIKALKELEGFGFIQVIQEARNQYQSCIIEICHVKNEQALAQPLDKALIQHCSTIEATTAPIDKPVNKEIKENNEIIEAVPSAVPAAAIDFGKFIEGFNAFAKREFRVTEKVKAALRSRLKKYTKVEIMTAIATAHKDQYHIDTKFKYLTPEFILREDKLEKFLNQPKPASIVPTKSKFVM